MGESRSLIRRDFRLAAYRPLIEEMLAFTRERSAQTPDELWCIEHTPVYTLGLQASPKHILSATSIPIEHTDRGGEVTYHGPGQLVLYPLIHLKRYGLFVREFVHLLEEAILMLLSHHGLENAERWPGEPGIYMRVGPEACRAKIAALGLKISRGFSTHGLAINLSMDLGPFRHINPCGHAGLQAIDLDTMNVHLTWEEAADQLCQILTTLLNARR